MSTNLPNNLDAFWMPFTANRSFKKNPRIISAAKDMHYTSHDGRQIIDGTSGLWCCNAGHAREPIVSAIQNAALTLDYAPPFQFGHPDAFKLATRIVELAPGDLNQVFFTNSGSEAVDTALKIALAYWRAKGEGQRTRFIGRERGYHGVGFGGISVGGIVSNRKTFGPMLNGVDHLPHTYNRSEQAFTKGEPEWGAHLADNLEQIIALHDASTIAAVIIEPMAGSTGVLPPPKGYLERLRSICDKHNILLIFDEVITGFGRLGSAFAANRYNVQPDMITFAKAVNSGTVPMGGVITRAKLYDALMTGPEHMVELFHGYTYSAHPLACAAALATLSLYKSEGLFEKAKGLENTWASAIMTLQNIPQVQDIRVVGLAAGIDLLPKDKPGISGFEAMEHSFNKADILIRITGDTIALSPPLIMDENHIGEIVDKVSQTIRAIY
ncbi:aspartate aminotransferase family protein [Microvirga sp. W0021]|uniref:Aspartate aminotransferase family protein n=1 Tax=Hohaiivirga grylli TaxID=3133970 RepID=A0ABV0BGH5_9HYPH